MMYEQLVTAGILVIFIGFALVILGAVLGSSKSSGSAKTEWGFFGLIGPFPIGFGSSKNTLLFATAISATFFLIFILLNILHR